MKLHVVGGFLGAGKTTLVRAMASRLRAAGERVVVMTNDQGQTLVDTALCRADGLDVTEIGSGCFCCRYEALDAALAAASDAGATTTIAEAVGSCTDLVATVLAPLENRFTRALEVAPLAIAVDPWRIAELESAPADDDVRYLFHKQIEEAEIILVTRADLSPPNQHATLKKLAPGATILMVSGKTGEGLSEWITAKSPPRSQPLSLDYTRYASAEARLGWSNATVTITDEQPFDPSAVIRRFLDAVRDAPIAHLKLVSIDPKGGRAAVVRRSASPDLDLAALPRTTHRLSLLVNARVDMPPDQLDRLLRTGIARAAAPAEVDWENAQCFQPGRPTPTHRFARRCGSAQDAMCCAAFYDRPDVRQLLGESFHPGGVRLSVETAGALQLSPNAHLLDVASGDGASLRAISKQWTIRPVGLDAAISNGGVNGVSLIPADAHAIPFVAASFDAILCECALSTFVSPATALREMNRVLKPRGRLGLSDMIVDGDLPETLSEWIHTGTCLARAMTADGYASAIEQAGFTVLEQRDASGALTAMIRGMKRNLVGMALAGAVGAGTFVEPINVARARTLFRAAEQAIANGVIGYRVFIAERTT